MARPDLRECLAWVLFASVMAVHLHSRTQLERCMTQLDSSRTQMRSRAASPVAETSGPREVILRYEPSGTVGHVELADATSGKPLPPDFVRAEHAQTANLNGHRVDVQACALRASRRAVPKRCNLLGWACTGWSQTLRKPTGPSTSLLALPFLTCSIRQARVIGASTATSSCPVHVS